VEGDGPQPPRTAVASICGGWILSLAFSVEGIPTSRGVRGRRAGRADRAGCAGLVDTAFPGGMGKVLMLIPWPASGPSRVGHDWRAEAVGVWRAGQRPLILRGGDRDKLEAMARFTAVSRPTLARGVRRRLSGGDWREWLGELTGSPTMVVRSDAEGVQGGRGGSRSPPTGVRGLRVA